MPWTADTDHWAISVRHSSEAYFLILFSSQLEKWHKLPLVCHRVGCPELGQPLTHPVFLLGLASSKSCVVAHLEQGKEPWVPNRVDMSPATAREARRGPGSGEWELGAEVTSGLGSHCSWHLPCVH